MRSRLQTALIIGVLAAESATAQRVAMGVDIDVTFLNQKAATANDISRVGGGFDVVFALVNKTFGAGLDMGMFFHDLGSQILTREIGSGAVSPRGNALIIPISAWAGFQLPGFRLNQNDTRSARLALAMAGGNTRIVSAFTNYGDCLDCESTDLAISGGPFLEPSVKLLFDSRELTLAYRTFRGGDMSSAIVVRFLAPLRAKGRAK